MKALARTPELIARLRASFGAEADVNDLVAYECIAANTLPLRKRGSLYDKARFAVSLMSEMVTSLERESVPIQIMHDTGVLPIGRAFAARVVDETLYVQFAINSKTQPAIIADLDAGVIDQVSVGVLSSKLLCSECNFDYMSDEATYEHWWSRTCANGHTVGEDGTHVRLAGLDQWYELSLVGKGAVNGARVISQSDSVFANSPSFQRLAASAVPTQALVCSAVPTPATKKDSTMDKEFLAQLTAAVEAKAVAEAANAPLTASLTAANTALEAANARIVELEAAAKDAPKVEDLKAATDALKEMARKICVASGEQEPVIPEAISEIVTLVEERQAKMTALIKPGAVSEAADKIVKATGVNGHAFKTRR